MFRLWKQDFWIFTLIALLTGVPSLLLVILDHEWSAFLALPHFSIDSLVLVLDVFLTAVATAAILGLLAQDDANVSRLIWRNIRIHTWPLAKLWFYIVLIMLGPGILCAMAFALFTPFRAAQPLALLVLSFYISLSNAIAGPLVVAEGIGARAAFRRNWQMMRGYFWYVFGCYMFLVGPTEFIRWLISSANDHQPFTAAQIIFRCGEMILGPLWLILSWVVYLRIKEADAPLPAI